MKKYLALFAFIFMAGCIIKRDKGVSEGTNPETGLFSTLQVSGRDLIDTCGRTLVLRGPEQFAIESLALCNDGTRDCDAGGQYDPLKMPAQIALTGANAMRSIFFIRPPEADNVAFMDHYLSNVTDAGLVTAVMLFWDTYPRLPFNPTCNNDGGFGTERPCLCDDPVIGGHCDDAGVQDSPICCVHGGPCPVDFPYFSEGLCRHSYPEWFRKSANKALIDKYKKWVLIDTGNERWSADGGRLELMREIKNDIAVFRDAGYEEPLVYISGQAGLDLPFILKHGKEIFESDPLRRTIGGWQAYWGDIPCQYQAPGPTPGFCVPPSGYLSCGWGGDPTIGWYQNPGDPNSDFSPYGGQPDGGQFVLASPTSLVNGVDVLAAATRDAGFPAYIGFTSGDFGQSGVADFANAIPEAYITETSWLWWSFYLPNARGPDHPGMVDDGPDWSAAGIQPCKGYRNGLYFTCEVSPTVNQPDWQDQICFPSWSTQTVFTYMDAGTNRACGR